MKWIKDEEFIRGNIPMTKFDVRILTMGYLAIEEGDELLDIGAGTGSVSMEAALHGAKVWAIEREEEGVELIYKNMEKFNVSMDVIQGAAPISLPDIQFNKCFIGGSGGKLEEIFSYLEHHLKENGILCANFITINNLNQFINLLKKYQYKSIETQLVQTSYMDKIGLMKANNPIFIVKGVKGND